MSYQIAVRVDRDNSVDPSYIIHYRVTDDGSLVGDGIVKYHRLAQSNDIPLHEHIPDLLKQEVREKIIDSVEDYINQRR